MESENRHDGGATIGTFDHPRYELVGTGEVFDGEAEVRRYFAEGTHRGPLRGLPPTGRAFSCPMRAVFAFAPLRRIDPRPATL
ncbi:MAG TPA: hypothetical protein VK932_15760 [Kofleriaceae bacterium]|nr:hypothetical protein [Kofleriaceae bacterium]